MPMNADPHCFPSIVWPECIYRNDAANCSIADSLYVVRLALALAHSSHYLKNRTKLAPIHNDEAKKTQPGRKY